MRAWWVFGAFTGSAALVWGTWELYEHFKYKEEEEPLLGGENA